MKKCFQGSKNIKNRRWSFKTGNLKIFLTFIEPNSDNVNCYFRSTHSRMSCKCHFGAKRFEWMRADVNVMARIRPTVTADEEDDRENVKMEEPFVPHNFPRANVASNAIEKKKKMSTKARWGGGERESRKEREDGRGKKNKPDRIGIAHAVLSHRNSESRSRNSEIRSLP